ncbi:YcnI family protein [Patulibacter defluvii]|uniref:YcnI family protein n=1 Tax=Patulibacter defluvii TaxID=3095358 RepID=UPI002A74DDD0|nr:YcnI family protein [Patulibacter sp. DM4]
MSARARRRRIAAGAVAATLLLAPAASAHVTVQPSASRPADLQRYRVTVPNEEQAADTTAVRVQLPKGIDFLLVEATPGWKAKVVRRGDQPSEIRWTGGRVPPGAYAELRFIARNPVRTGTLTFKALQQYSDGEVARWIGSADSENPAPTVELSESAVPQDVVSTHGEATPTATAPGAGKGQAAPAATAAKDDDSDALTIVALVVAVVALGLAAVATLRRRA